MKHLYFLLALAFLILHTSAAQEIELFENTWYLRTVQVDDLATLYDVAEIDPPIAPYLIISEDFNFNGIGACNTFDGSFTFYSPNNLTTNAFTATNDDCGVQDHDRFEDAYFGYISSEFWYDISQEGEGAVLTMGNPLGGVAVFKSHSLSTNDFYKNEFTIYPNPVNDVLVLKSQVETGKLFIKIFNIEGKLLSTYDLEFENQVSVDVSKLASGIYFLNIEDGNGNTEVKKFLKE